jgi:hypothetical protein
MSDEPKERNILKLILIVRFACAALGVGHPIVYISRIMLLQQIESGCRDMLFCDWTRVYIGKSGARCCPCWTNEQEIFTRPNWLQGDASGVDAEGRANLIESARRVRCLGLLVKPCHFLSPFNDVTFARRIFQHQQ